MPALHTNMEHSEEERFPLVDAVSYRQRGWILWWSQRSLQLLGDPSFSRLNPSHITFSCPWKNCFSPSPGKYFPPLRTFFHCRSLSPASFQPQTTHSPVLFTPQKNNRERGVSRLATHSCYFSLKADCPSQLMVISSSVGNGPWECRLPPPWGKDYTCHTYLSDTQVSSQQVRVHTPKNTVAAAAIKKCLNVSQKTLLGFLPKDGWEGIKWQSKCHSCPWSRAVQVPARYL